MRDLKKTVKNAEALAANPGKEAMEGYIDLNEKYMLINMNRNMG